MIPVPTPGPAGARLTRRALLVGTAGTLLLAACGGDDGNGAAAPTTLSLEELDPDGLILTPSFNPGPGYAAAGVPQRLTWMLRSGDGAPLAEGPSALPVTFLYAGDGDGGAPQQEGDGTEATFHDEGIPLGYYVTRFTPERAGFYTMRAEVGDDVVEASFQVSEPADVRLVQVGAAMPAIQTPTVEDARGVEPICTLNPPCPLHETTLAANLESGRPVAFLVSTPAFCQTAVCGPVLDLLVEATTGALAPPETAFIHAEVYVRPEPGDPTAAGVTPAIEECGMDFEPSLFLVDEQGVVAERLDNVYDAAELRDGLALL